MDISPVTRTDILTVESATTVFDHSLIQTLERFTRQHYTPVSHDEFLANVLSISKQGHLALYYDHQDKLTGFSRLCRETLFMRSREIIIFTGGTYHNPRHCISYEAAKFGLIQAMKYKLENPEKELVLFLNASTPAKYRFLAEQAEVFYPCRGIVIPEHVLALVKLLKQQNGWSSCPQHPMLLSNQITFLDTTLPTPDKTNEHVDYYLTINPDYKNGNSLLIYLPLNLATISHGIKQVVSHAVC
ncbi:hypothetical protein [Legionella spiritensis]|uniref:Uncharacterized protein n=1 Tax=Legionella spiritensis TaxID=452 RepID=A0A0W0Z6M4_LEGSP|nr:hypothetical protein [Legionella spiritensis]KTD64745.1 hypothetical protein Lspi_0912 [Legionella spiritensis]SNV48166.1 Uncharacterised protein [Legionella spiritensis]